MNDLRVLVIDDEPLNLEIIGEYLDDSGYQLTSFLSADEAWVSIDSMRQTLPDLVVLDRMMPGMDGMTFLRKLKADRDFAAIPVIMQTAAAAPEQVEEGIAAGAYYYLAKPYSAATLLAVVHSALESIAPLRQRTTSAPIAALLEEEVRDFEFSSLEEARELANQLSAWCPQPDLAVLGLTELFINAIEHGNLEISYSEKVKLRLTDKWESEILRRQLLPEYADRRVKVQVQNSEGKLEFTVTDCGKGFDWTKYLEIDPARAFDPSGRGIAMARQISFDAIEYKGAGNIVVASVLIGNAQ